MDFAGDAMGGEEAAYGMHPLLVAAGGAIASAAAARALDQVLDAPAPAPATPMLPSPMELEVSALELGGDVFGVLPLVATIGGAVASALPLVFKGVASAAARSAAKKSSRAAVQPAARRARARPPELDYLEAVAARDPSRFREALRAVASRAPQPTSEKVGDSMSYGSVIFGADGRAYQVVGSDGWDVDVDLAIPGLPGISRFVSNIFDGPDDRPDWNPPGPRGGPGGYNPPGPRGGPGGYNPPGPRGGPGGGRRQGIPRQLAQKIARLARVPQNRAHLLRIIQGADGRPKVGLDTGYGVEVLGDFGEAMGALGYDVGDDVGAEDFGGEFIGSEYGAVNVPGMSVMQAVEYLRRLRALERVAGRIELDSWGMPRGQLRSSLRVDAGGRSPAVTGELMKIPLYTTTTGTNPRISLTVPGGSVGAVVATATLTTRPYSWNRYRIVGIESNFGDRSSGATVVFRYLRVVGADINLILNDSTAYSDADDWDLNAESSPGLRTGEGSVVEKTNTANLDIGITGDDGDTAVGTVKLICEKLDDVVSNVRATPYGA